LIRAAVYHGIGGHREIRLRPDDDLKLGKLVKRHGFQQELVFGRGMVIVEWYATVMEMVRGLEKNSFAGVDYRIDAVVGSLAAIVVLHIFPFVGMFLTPQPACWIYAAIAAIYWGLAAYSARELRQPWYAAVCYPLAMCLFVAVFARNVALNLWQGGLQWRGTFYALEELRRNQV
jgi:hypothetical protein